MGELWLGVSFELFEATAARWNLQLLRKLGSGSVLHLGRMIKTPSSVVQCEGLKPAAEVFVVVLDLWLFWALCIFPGL